MAELIIISVHVRNLSSVVRLILTTFVGIVFGFFLGASFPTLSLTKINLPAPLLPSVDLTYIEDKYSGLSTQALLNVWSTLKLREVDPSQGQTSNDSEVRVHFNILRVRATLPVGITTNVYNPYSDRP
ncbi:Histidine--tRNA ligase [Bienertia sinuspersici]